MSEEESLFPLGTKFWVDFCEKLNNNGKYVWVLTYNELGMVVGVEKLMDRSQVLGFKKLYGGFVTGFNIGIYTEAGVERPVERMDLSGTKKQY
jgi:hypothetical protein